MTTEELKAIENLTAEIKELRKVLTIVASGQYAKIKYMNTNMKPTRSDIIGYMSDGLTIIEDLKQEV